MANKNIKCSVESCKHHDSEEQLCDLEEIQVGCDCENDECECEDDTVCNSFECKEKAE